MLFNTLARTAVALTGMSSVASAASSSGSAPQSAATGSSSHSSGDFPTLEVVGNKFFYSNNGSQFYIRGIAYQADVSGQSNNSFTDPLADEAACTRDLPYLVAANTNVLRVYAIDTEQDHSACMEMFQNAGIYIVADLAEPTLSISTTDPSWDLGLYQRYTSVIDEMQQYDNVLGFFAGNEVLTNSTTSDCAAYVKAAIRDMRQYMSDQGYRRIPLGYAANDDAGTRVSSADYFACGDDEVRADFYGVNMYEWCGQSSFTASGYRERTQEFANLTIPLFFSEYGCNEVSPRRFTDIATLFSDDMTNVWSGGIVYMYFQEANDYGLVSVDGDHVSTLADYGYYSSQINHVSPTLATASEVSASAASTSMACPATGRAWRASSDLPPTPDENICNCMANSVSCIVSDDVDSDDYGDLFGVVCGLIDCTGINGNAARGEYGAYSFCSSRDKLNFALNLYYESQGNPSACDFSGSATLGGSSTTGSSCRTVLEQAGASGLGTVSASGSSHGHHSAAAGSGSHASGSSDATGSAAAASGSGAASSSSAAAAGSIDVKGAFGFSLTMSLGALLSFLFL